MKCIHFVLALMLISAISCNGGGNKAKTQVMEEQGAIFL